VVSEFRYDAGGRVLAEMIGGALATGYGYGAIGRSATVTSHTVSGGVLSAALRTADGVRPGRPRDQCGRADHRLRVRRGRRAADDHAATGHRRCVCALVQSFAGVPAHADADLDEVSRVNRNAEWERRTVIDVVESAVSVLPC
jgi:hypothetical protein